MDNAMQVQAQKVLEVGDAGSTSNGSLVELSELHLSLIGGGAGDTIWPN